MKKILVPTDFSNEAINAHVFAKQIAQKMKAEILLLHVLEVPYGSFNVMGEVVTNYSYEHLYESQLIKRSEERLEEFVADFKTDGVSATSKLIYGNPFVSIKNTIFEQNVDLVVMGSKGASGLKEIFIGSNAERVIRYAQCPVITVKGRSDLENIKNIALATDTTAEQDRIMPEIKKFQKLFGVNLHMVRVCTPYNYLTEEKAKEDLKDFAERNKLENYTIGVAHADFTDEGVVEFALKNNIHMIAMGTHGRTGLGHFFGGSITEDVANHAHIPILTIKIPKE